MASWKVVAKLEEIRKFKGVTPRSVCAFGTSRGRAESRLCRTKFPDGTGESHSCCQGDERGDRGAPFLLYDQRGTKSFFQSKRVQGLKACSTPFSSRSCANAHGRASRSWRRAMLPGHPTSTSSTFSATASHHPRAAPCSSPRPTPGLSTSLRGSRRGWESCNALDQEVAENLVQPILGKCGG